MVPVILASASQTRSGLLAAAGVPFTARPAPLDERLVEAPLIAAGASPAVVAAALAEAKAIAVSRAVPAAIVIGADQVLDLDGARWTKPATFAEAREQLARLSGREHRLQTAVAGARDGTVIWRHAETARLTMRPLSAAVIDRYLERIGEAALLSVGTYQIEGFGIRLFEKVDGDHFAILGLPLLPVLQFLRREAAID
jgi:septum formation protein